MMPALIPLYSASQVATPLQSMVGLLVKVDQVVEGFLNRIDLFEQHLEIHHLLTVVAIPGGKGFEQSYTR